MSIDISINAENFRHASRREFAQLVAEVCENRASIDFDIEVIKAILGQLDGESLAEVFAAINHMR